MKKSRIQKTIIMGIAILALFIQSALSVHAMTVYESDGTYHAEGYIIIGESHSAMAAHAFGLNPEVLGNDITFDYLLDSSIEVTESGSANTFTMKGNLFFVFEGDSGADGNCQTQKDYIYSDGAGKRGRGVEKIHEIIDTNQNVAHWNIISMHGAAEARLGSEEVAKYYVNSYRNWMKYEFPQADFYFLSVATMTKYYRATPDKAIFNDTLAAAFPDKFLDYTDFYASRSKDRMIDTIHWDSDTYIDLILDVMGKVAQNRPKTVEVEYTVTDVDEILYTNDTTVFYVQPAVESAVVSAFCETGVPVQVTGVTSNGFYRVCISADGEESFVAGDGLSQNG